MLREHRQRKAQQSQVETSTLYTEPSLLSAERAAAIEAHQKGAGLTVSQPARLAGAATVWMSLTFMLCYLALPLARASMGLTVHTADSVMATALASTGGLMGVMALSLFGIFLARPAASLNVNPDRILSATAGGLLVWGFLHNVLPGLIHFADMGGGELATFVGSNIIENALFGVMLASIARTGRGAFTLGVLFQAALVLISYHTMFMRFCILRRSRRRNQ